MTGALPLDPDDLPPDSALALDYALGALDRAARRDVETRLRSDPAFRALVEGWQAALAPLDAETAAVPPPAELWDRIAAEVTPRAIPTAAPAAAPAPVRRSLWESLALWRGLALAGTAAAAIAFAAVLAPAPAPPGVLVARLAAADGTPLLSAAYDPLRGAVVLTPATEAEHKGKSPELWVIEGDKPPRSLGLIDIDGANAHVIPRDRIAGLKPGSTLAISIEPLGGSPTGAPTGPIVATGTLSAI
ncbi:hypothetical protein IP88_05455 [alpha proteobacterium AAP81b]|nr:hypothetical protein IP88_05455 [alpha proteobacterium AAP81b]